MKPHRRLVSALAGLVLLPFAACQSERSADVHAPGLKSRKAVVAVEPLADDRIVAGQTLYVPAYSSVFTSDQAHRFNLAIMLAIRNTDPKHPLVLDACSYHDQDGALVRDYVPRPLRIGPLASVVFYVTESDVSGGVASSFLVDWVADQPVSPPAVEALMLGTSSSQGVSFACPARVLRDRTPPGARP